ncbi:hypothetical protein [Amycolatopsis pretoriensis]|uniref:hypothetical protein n=1 Tax=Amycolatopsis pretoriensis TaxID=218821 RepID=UPI001FCA07C8|nr:hypothetical protein [Amycolatopsis pretoriensis]
MILAERTVEGPVTLTAPTAATFADLAAEHTGREVKRVVVDDEQWVAGRIAAGTPEPMARMLLAFFIAARRGDFAETGPRLEELLGREPLPAALV